LIAISTAGEVVSFSVRVIPRAGRTAVAGVRDGALVIRLAAPPVEGMANAALTAFVAKLLHCPKRDVTILAGHKSREKRVAIAGLAAGELTHRLSTILPA
jgi:uncharacterized protein (TIGR00251 family)